jgi:hypothetical protein
MFICNIYMGWEIGDHSQPRPAVRAAVRDAYMSISTSSPDALFMLGGDRNCSGLQWAEDSNRWVATQEESAQFLDLAYGVPSPHNLKIVNKMVQGAGIFTRFQGRQFSTLDVILSNTKLFNHAKSYTVDTDCEYFVKSDHRLITASF